MAAGLLCPRDASPAATVSARRIYLKLPMIFSYVEIGAHTWETHSAPKGISVDPHVESDTESGQLYLLNSAWIFTSFSFLLPVSEFRPQTLSLWH